MEAKSIRRQSIIRSTARAGRRLLHGWTMDHRVELADYEKIFAGHRGGSIRTVGKAPGGEGRLTQDDAGGALAFIDRVVPTERFVPPGRRWRVSGACRRARCRSRVAGPRCARPASTPRRRRTLPVFRPIVRNDELGALDAEGTAATFWSRRPTTLKR